MSVITMAQICELYDGTQRDLDKMVVIEEVMFPAILERSKQRQGEEENARSKDSINSR